MLTRHFIADALGRYFSHNDVVVGSFPIPFTTLLNRWEYRNVVSQKYSGSPSGWLTPVEIFSPHYSNALARYMLAQCRASLRSEDPLVIYEIGGGRGSNAVYTLDWLKQNAPSVYSRCEYTLVEFSPHLRDVQAAAVASHHARARVLAADATDLAASLAPDSRPCFVICLEVLDNLPHDKVVRFGSGPWHETSIVDDSKSGVISEAYAPAADDLIREALGVAQDMGLPGLSASLPSTPVIRGRVLQALKAMAAFPRTGSKLDLATLPRIPKGVTNAAYLPTGALQLVRGLSKLFGRHRLLLADFDSLPPPVVHATTFQTDRRVDLFCPAHGSPLTASKDAKSRSTVDHASYIHAPIGTADIFFPTDFSLIAELVRHVHRTAAHTQPDSEPEAASGTQVPASRRNWKSTSSRPPGPPAALAGATHNRADDLAVEVLSSAQFLQRYAEVGKTRTMTGYNPMIEDYINTRFLLT